MCPLARLYRNLADAARDIEDEVFKAEVQEAARRVEGMRVGIGEFLGQTREDHVYWIERYEKRDTHLTLTAAPVEVASQLRKLLFRPDNTVIMTSATLAVGDGLRYFVNRWGARWPRRCRSIRLSITRGRCACSFPKKMPEPMAREAYEGALVALDSPFRLDDAGQGLRAFHQLPDDAKAGR